MTPHKTAINSSETFKEYLKITLASGLSGYFFSVAVTWVTSNIIITANHELVSFMLKIFTGTSISVWMDAYFFIAFGGG